MINELVATTFLLLLLLDPLGNIPLVLALLRPLPEARHKPVVLRECAVAGVALLVFAFFGDWLLAAMRLSSSALEISGGLILFLIALRMVFPSKGIGEADPDFAGEPLIVPLAIPMIAGPAALATVLLTARQAEHLAILLVAIVVAVAINTVILLGAERLARLFGNAGLEALERLMGLLLTTMAVQMLISGIKVAFFPPPMP
jgi:multiple antibiotic resistance protein